MPEIRRNGPYDWVNIHSTEESRVSDQIDIINPASGRGTTILRAVAASIEQLVSEARAGSRAFRAVGSGWALTDIAATRGWLLNTQTLNGRFNVTEQYASPQYPARKSPFLLICQCGVTISELNRYLELTPFAGNLRALRTAGVGAGQTVVGAVSGNTHGAGIKVGAVPDFVVGIQLVNGTGQPIWLERASAPVMDDAFIVATGSTPIRDDDLFNAAVVSFGSFGVVTAVAIETDPLYQLKFGVNDVVPIHEIKHRLRNFDENDPVNLHHYEAVFNPYADEGMEAIGLRMPFERPFPTPDPRWIVRGKTGFAPGSKAGRIALRLPIPAKAKVKLQFDAYKRLNILGSVQGTPGQLFTASITYSEGLTESAFAVSLDHAARMVEIVTSVVTELRIPAFCQVRMVHPTRATLGFTHHAPKSVVFEIGLVKDEKHGKFERRLVETCRREGIALAFHWSKNSGLTADLVRESYGDARVDSWLDARSRLFQADASLMTVFANDHLRRSGLAG